MRPLYARVGRKLISSLPNETFVRDRAASERFDIRPRGYREAIARALANEDREVAETRWSDALSSGGRAVTAARGQVRGRIVDSQVAEVPVPPERAFAPVRRIGGATGWYLADRLWQLRGLLDLLVGGVGLRRGRRDPETPIPGSALDFWRVEAYEPDTLLRLRAEMPVPGRAWLQLEVDGDEAQLPHPPDCDLRPDGPGRPRLLVRAARAAHARLPRHAGRDRPARRRPAAARVQGRMTRTGVVLFTRDLRVRDNPALAAASRSCEQVVPLFVLDEGLLAASRNRSAFLRESLADLRDSIGLVVRRGDPVTEVGAFEPDAVYLGEDVSPLARRRERRLRSRFSVHTVSGPAIVPPGELSPAGRGHYSVFGPYWRAWRALPLPARAETQLPLRIPAGIDPGPLPEVDSRGPWRGGESAGLARLHGYDVSAYDGARDDLAADRTSRLSPYLHLGCVSAADVARAASAGGAEQLLRQLCWRDFYLQLLAARPDLPSADLRPAPRAWRDDAEAVAAWKQGATGVPLVDAAMRQLAGEGWIPNRARLVAASFLVKQLGVDWRIGAAHFLEHLVDGDLASNSGNWQWVAGTGTDTRPNRFFNPALQGRRHDPDGDYVRRWVPELAPLPAGEIHDPAPRERRALGYPEPIVDQRAAAARIRRRQPERT